MNGRRFTFSCRINRRVPRTGFLIPSFHHRTNGSITLAPSVLITIRLSGLGGWLAVMTVQSALVMRAQATVASHCGPTK
jgi:hypothetical protein